MKKNLNLKKYNLIEINKTELSMYNGGNCGHDKKIAELIHSKNMRLAFMIINLHKQCPTL